MFNSSLRKNYDPAFIISNKSIVFIPSSVELKRPIMSCKLGGRIGVSNKEKSHCSLSYGLCWSVFLTRYLFTGILKFQFATGSHSRLSSQQSQLMCLCSTVACMCNHRLIHSISNTFYDTGTPQKDMDTAVTHII